MEKVRKLQTHSEPEQTSIAHVKWFHTKFISPYILWQWPQMEWDHIAITDVINKYKLSSFLEIGTWKGYTSLLVWMLPGVHRIKAIDIHDKLQLQGDYNHRLHKLSNMHEYGTYFKNTPVQLCFADTMSYIPDENEQYDLIFIDGNHDYEHVKNDTKLALRMNPKLIIWHDYEESNPGVVQWINELLDNGSVIIGFSNSICVGAQPKYIRMEKT